MPGMNSSAVAERTLSQAVSVSGRGLLFLSKRPFVCCSARSVPTDTPRFKKRPIVLPPISVRFWRHNPRACVRYVFFSCTKGMEWQCRHRHFLQGNSPMPIIGGPHADLTPRVAGWSKFPIARGANHIVHCARWSRR
jgi:hypothetical protein